MQVDNFFSDWLSKNVCKWRCYIIVKWFEFELRKISTLNWIRLCNFQLPWNCNQIITRLNAAWRNEITHNAKQNIEQNRIMFKIQAVNSYALLCQIVYFVILGRWACHTESTSNVVDSNSIAHSDKNRNWISHSYAFRFHKYECENFPETRKSAV